ncbi:DUF4136 domain-containing protein [Thalassotalea atypica]|uniref:DUF4136 domain-containing protein n=1 Tax=Thalassotalea atypica TaxID=2054316 RepID=UPI0025743CEA|nr:DUF4136 domain-containing protein [Thalassotalea atypica]
MKNIMNFIICVLVLSGCSTTYTPKTDVEPEFDFASVKTFYVIGDQQNPNIMLSDIDRRRMNKAMTQELIATGYEEADVDSADILISYFVATEDKVKINSHGHTPHYAYAARVTPAYRYGYGVSNISAKSYTEGTFVVDIIDRDSNESMWRSTLTKPLKHYQTIEERENAITDLVSTMFQERPSSL